MPDKAGKRPPCLRGRTFDGKRHRSGWAWLKTFLSTCFEIVIIALVFALGGMLNNALQSVAVGDVNGWFDGFLSVLCDMIYMIFLTVSVSGAGGLLRRAFDLR